MKDMKIEAGREAGKVGTAHSSGSLLEVQRICLVGK